MVPIEPALPEGPSPSDLDFEEHGGLVEAEVEAEIEVVVGVEIEVVVDVEAEAVVV